MKVNMYSHFFGFSNKPFHVIFDPMSFDLTTCHMETLASMIYGFDAGKGFLSITGEEGIGKTTLLYTFLKQLQRIGNTVFIFRTHIPFIQVIKNLLKELKLPVMEDEVKTVLKTLNEHLMLKLHRGENIGIIVDEAQNLPKEGWYELGLLSSLEGSMSESLQIILMGQPELEGMLETKALGEINKRIGKRLQLKPLTEKECIRYIDYHLHLVGGSSVKIFTPGAMSLICHFSKGIPKVINTLCDKAFQMGYQVSQKQIDENIIREVAKNMNHVSLQKPNHREPALLCFAMEINPSLQSALKSKKVQRRSQDTIEFDTEPHPIPLPNMPLQMIEELHRMKYNILRIDDREKNKTLLFSSTKEVEGNSTILIHFAITLASEGHRVLLVDGNLRHPTFHHVFNVEKRNGLTELSLKKATLRDVIKETQFSNLSVITCGMDSPNPFAIVESKSLDSCIEEMRAWADWVLFDSPPVNSFNDSIALATKMDGVILVVEAERTKWEAALRAKQRIEGVKGNILGVVLNRRRLYVPKWLYRRL